MIFTESAFREAVKRDLKEEADYGTDDTFTVGARVGRAVRRCSDAGGSGERRVPDRR
jgi:hypothetical protein